MKRWRQWLFKCKEPWPMMTPEAASVYGIVCCRRRPHVEHTAGFGTTWS